MIDQNVVFYDGDCGLCHFFIRLTLKYMDFKAPFYFAPLKGVKFQEVCLHIKGQALPESIVVYISKKNQLLFKGKAIAYILSSFPSRFWRLCGFIMKLMPLIALNFFYDLLAKSRHKFFKKPMHSCPIVDSSLKKFFLD